MIKTSRAHTRVGSLSLLHLIFKFTLEGSPNTLNCLYWTCVILTNIKICIYVSLNVHIVGDDTIAFISPSNLGLEGWSSIKWFSNGLQEINLQVHVYGIKDLWFKELYLILFKSRSPKRWWWKLSRRFIGSCVYFNAFFNKFLWDLSFIFECASI